MTMIPGKQESISVESVKLINLPSHFDTNGGLVVIEGETHIPFNIARVFTVIAPAGAIRGQHAHYICSQFLTCPKGHIEVLCDDGKQTKTFLLNDPKVGLHLPCGIWAQQTYITDSAVLNVLCDHKYDAQDYIRDYNQFKNYSK